MALKGLKVLEFAGLAPVPFCGMVLSDFGASVIRIDRVNAGTPVPDTLSRGKRSIGINLKTPAGQSVVHKLASKSDVLVEPFRPGVMEKLNLGPDILMRNNPRLIYARLSGYGQDGPYAHAAGHDINYLSISGILSKLGRRGEVPTPPINLIADFGGGGLLCAFGILMSLFERHSSGKGQIVDVSMVEGGAYLSSFVFNTQHLPIWGKPKGQNLLDSGAPFYNTYETKDGKYMAVGAIEPQFYARLMEGLQLDIPQFSDFESGIELVKAKFLSKTQAEWVRVFTPLDACVTPVLEQAEAIKDQQNIFRGTFLQNQHTKQWEAAPAPKLSRTPGSVELASKPIEPGEHTLEVLKEFGYTLDKIREEFKSDTESGISVTSEVLGPVTGQACQPPNPARRHSSATYRRASQFAVEISLEDMRAQTRGIGGRFRHAVSRLFGQKSKVAQTDSTRNCPLTVTGNSSGGGPTTVTDDGKHAVLTRPPHQATITPAVIPSGSKVTTVTRESSTRGKPTKEPPLPVTTKDASKTKESKSKVKGADKDKRRGKEVTTVVNMENETTKLVKPKELKLKTTGKEKIKDEKPGKKEKVKEVKLQKEKEKPKEKGPEKSKSSKKK